MVSKSIYEQVEECPACQDRRAIAAPGESYRCSKHSELLPGAVASRNIDNCATAFANIIQALPDAVSNEVKADVAFMLKYLELCAEAITFLAERGARQKPVFPKVVCLCGSTRFMEAFQEANLRETMEGRIVLSVGCNTQEDSEVLAKHGGQAGAMKQGLDELHKRKIDLADEVLVLNVGGYIGESTRLEIDYAMLKGKPVRFLEA